MGFGGISWPQLLIILVIVLLLFGTKRLRGLGGDLGGAIKGFKKAMKEEGATDTSEKTDALEENTQNKNEAEADKTENAKNEK